MPLINATQCVLIVIDVQEEFYGPERMDVDRESFSAIVDRIAWLTGVSAALNVPVVVTEEDPELNKHTFSKVSNQLPPSAVVLPKFAFAAPDNPDILAAIEQSGADTAVLVGMETDVCVAHTALRLKDLGWRVVAVEDALYSPNDAHRNGVRRMVAADVELVSAKELYYDWLPSYPLTREFESADNDVPAVPAGVVL